MNDFKTGQRVQLHPATDAWMRGDRFGTVVALGRKLPSGSSVVHVQLDTSGRTVRMHSSNITHIL